MKRIKYLYIAFISVLMLSLNSCEQFEQVSGINEIETFNTTVNVILELDDEIPMPEELSVKLVNFAERYELNTTVGVDGGVTIPNVIPGIYTVTVSGKFHQDQFTYNYNGNAVNVDIVSDNRIVEVQVGGSKSGALLFKEVYYAGSSTPAGGSYFRDQFYEIY